mmetsp:Transcript_16768/g.45829  ORF Transcript_16768/g.45829 Transcript_16768/m.45829 type:complete len:229 (+) Transcript_16768:474-1160(+)
MCSKMSGSTFSNSRRYAHAAGFELQVLCNTSLTTMKRASFSDNSVSTIVRDSVMHSAISMAFSLWSRQKTMHSRITARWHVTLRSNVSNRSQSGSVRRLAPATPRLSRSRFCRSCVARSSKRWRSRSSSMSACVHDDGMVPGSTDVCGLATALAAFASAAAGAVPAVVAAAEEADEVPLPTGGAADAADTAAAFVATISGPDEKFVFRVLFASGATLQGGGRHHFPPS